MDDLNVTRRDFMRGGAVAAVGAALGLTPTYTVRAGNPDKSDTRPILNYNPQMEYRRCGKTELMISAVCMGGHWKRIDKVVRGLEIGGGWIAQGAGSAEFEKNRHDVVSRCIDRGINYIDACVGQEVLAYSKALKGRRDKMYLGFSWSEGEMRSLGHQWASAAKAGKPQPAGWITQKLKEAFDHGLKQAGLAHVDLWRITCHEGSSEHSDREIEEMLAALEWAKKSGRARFTGISSHDRPHIKRLIEKFPQQLEVICTPYTAKTKMVTDESGLWAAMKKLERRMVRHQAFRQQFALQRRQRSRQPPRRRGQPHRPAGAAGDPLQSGNYRAHSGLDQPTTGRQRGLGRGGTPRIGP